MTDTDMLYVAGLEARIQELEEKHFSECAQIAHYDDELKEAKRLLKAAVEDIRYCMHSYDPCEVCALLEENGECVATDDNDCSEKYKWRYEAEALTLLGKDANVPASADDTNVGHKSGDWISCEDRLPSENTLVLCYARSTTGEGNQYFIGAIAHGEFWFLKVYDIGRVSHPVHYWEVTHWMPLPEPPKNGEQND